MVEQSMSSAPVASLGRMSLQTESTCLPAGSMVITTSASLTASAAEPRCSTPSDARLIAGGRRQVEADDVVPGLDEIGGHRAAHVAEADEGDLGHG